MKGSLRAAFNAWIGLSALVIISLIAIYVRNGIAGLNLYIQQWPLSNLAVTLASTALTWISVGMILYLLVNNKINAKNVFFVAGFFLVLLIYLGVLRERFRYGDYAYYIEAATALLKHKPLPDTYFYLPLWATMLQAIIPLGDQGVLITLWTLNIIALGFFYVLLVRFLERYGFSNRFAVVVSVLFMLINTPLHRTLGYVQINLIVMVLVIFSTLYFSKKTFLSALALALAVHLKTSPAALVLAFLLERNWRWVAWFGVSFLVLAIIPLALEGPSPYSDFINNIGLLSQSINTNFHDTSFDSFFRFFNPFFGIDFATTRIITLVVKIWLLLATIYIMAQNVSHQTFVSSGTDDLALLNGIPSLFIVMTLASPIVWDHHGLFVTLPFLLMLKCIDAPPLWVWFGFAYLQEFIMPSFDFFPWSFGRLVAPLIVLWLMWFVTRNKQEARFLNAANGWFESLPT
jgi:hypothetical protein